MAADGSLTPAQTLPGPSTTFIGTNLALSPDGAHLYAPDAVGRRILLYTVGAGDQLTAAGSAAVPAPNSGILPFTVVVAPDHGPTASFTATAASAGTPTSFSGAGSAGGDLAPVARYDWNFGDGTSALDAGPHPSHSYAKPGSYTVTLTVTDSAGCSTTLLLWDGNNAACSPDPGASAAQTVQIPAIPVQIPAIPVTRVQLPNNLFTITHLKARPSGTVSFDLKLPGPGAVDVLETAWNDNLASAASALQPAQRRFVFARDHVAARSSETIHVTVKPGASGRRLVARHRYHVRIRVWVSYTPTGGRQRNTGRYGLFVTP